MDRLTGLDCDPFLLPQPISIALGVIPSASADSLGFGGHPLSPSPLHISGGHSPILPLVHR